MTPLTCWPALLTGLFRDYRELFTESGPFFFLAQVSCDYLEFNELDYNWLELNCMSEET